MNIFVLIGHQKQGSFCHAIAAAAIEELEAAGHEVVYHDLYAEKLRSHSAATTRSPRARRSTRSSSSIAARWRRPTATSIVHPNWWAMPPAILKGWLDRVLRQGVAYQFGPGGVEPLLAGKRAVVLTTSNTPRDDELRLFGDPLENLWKTCVFSFCGVEDFYRRNFESIIMSTPEQRRGWLDEVRAIVRQRFPS